MTIAAAETRQPLPGAPIARSHFRVAGAGRFARVVVFGLFLVTLALSVCMVKWSIGPLPVRVVFAISILLFIAAAKIEIIVSEILRFRFIIAITVAVALIGVTASLLNDAEPGAVGRQLLEIHFQAVVNLIVGACVVRICGLGRSVFALAVVVGASILFALLQFAGIGAAFDVRNFLESFQPADPDGLGRYFLAGGRARGLSYSPVHLGTQLCILFAAVFGFLVHRYGRRIFDRLDHRVLLGAALVVLVSAASGNRSPILGVVVFLATYAWMLRPKGPALVFTLIALAVVPFTDQLFLALQEVGLRVGNTQDGSAVGRTALQVYGILLFLEQPFGYGLTFNSIDYSPQYWSDLIGFANAEAITKHALHNYYLLMLGKYGVLILFIAFFVAKRLLRSALLVLGFIPYMVHIFYHNDGPYQADFIIWFVIPLFSRIGAAGWCRSVPRQRAAPRVLQQGWRSGPSRGAQQGARS